MFIDKKAGSFEQWFKDLVYISLEQGQGGLIDEKNPQSYREYFDDGFSPIQCFNAEFK